jgi:hypothetical protein
MVPVGRQGVAERLALSGLMPKLLTSLTVHVSSRTATSTSSFTTLILLIVSNLEHILV